MNLLRTLLISSLISLSNITYANPSFSSDFSQYALGTSLVDQRVAQMDAIMKAKEMFFRACSEQGAYPNIKIQQIERCENADQDPTNKKEISCVGVVTGNCYR